MNIESLGDRRNRFCLKFVKQCLKNENFKKLFPLKKQNHKMEKRKSEKFIIKKMHTERYLKSAIPDMKRLLNKEECKISNMSNFNVTRENCFYNPISVKI